MSKLNTFDPKDLTILVAGHRVRGYAETQVAISRPDPMWNSQVGATGDTMRVKTNNKTTDVTITLQQSSPSIDVLTDIATEDENTSDGTFILSITYGAADNFLLQSGCAYIEKKADATWGNTPQDREFTIKCPNAEYDLGATTNPTVGKGTLAALNVNDPDVTP